MDTRKSDVLVEDGSNARNYIIWADPNLKDLILSVDGVTSVYLILGETRYDVFLDPRYDYDLVIEEIIAVIKCRED